MISPQYTLAGCFTALLSTDTAIAVILKDWAVMEQDTRLTNPGAVVVGEPLAAFLLFADFKACLLGCSLFKVDHVPLALALNPALRFQNLAINLSAQAIRTFWNAQH